jgi:hypothetical protein
MGVAVGSFWRRGGKSYGFILSLVIVFLYYICMNLGENLAKSGRAFTFIGIWLPNFLLGGLGLYVFFKVAREKPVPLLVWVEQTAVPGLQAARSWLRQKLGRA